MTLADYRTQIPLHQAFDLDNYMGTAPNNSVLDSQVNWALRVFASYTRCCYSTKITLTLAANDEEINLRNTSVVSRQVLRPDQVTINGNVLRRPDGEPGLWSLGDLTAFHPGYQTYSAATPARAIWLPGDKLLLSPKSDGAYNNSFIAGAYMPVALANSSDVPDIPEEYHEVLLFLAAVKTSKQNVSESEGWQRLASYDAEWREAVERLRKESANRTNGRQWRGMRSDWVGERMIL